jgi:hypothetical protein
MCGSRFTPHGVCVFPRAAFLRETPPGVQYVVLPKRVFCCQTTGLPGAGGKDTETSKALPGHVGTCPHRPLRRQTVALTWTITPAERLVVAVIEDTVTYADVEAYFEDVVAKGGIPFRKLVDARQGRSEITDAELLTYAGRVKAYSQMGKLGPLAVVAGENKSHDHSSLLRALAANGSRPLSIFANIGDAREWLDSVAPLTP